MNKWVLVGSCVIAFLIGTLAVFVFTKEDSPDEVLQDVVQDQVLTTGVGEDVWNPDGEPYVEWFAPENSFGMSYMKFLNESFYDGMWNNFINWSLWKSNNKNTWIETDEEGTLEIIKTTDINNSYKFMVNWTCQDTAFYQVRFVVNTDVVEYSNDSGYQFNLVYAANETENYSVFFNWSDLIESEWDQYLEYASGVWNDTFMFNATSINKVTKNTHVSLDPEFGYNGTGDTSIGMANDALGDSYAPSSSGTVDNVFVYFRERAGPTTLQVGIWLNSTKSLITNGDSDTYYVGVADEGSFSWHQFNFSTAPSVTADTYYLLGCSGDGANTVYRGDSSEHWTVRDLNMDVPITSSFVVSHTYSYDMCIYCTYTETPSEQWNNLPSMQFNISLSNTSQFEDLNTLQYNISLSNTSVFNSLFGLQFNISFSASGEYTQIPTMSYNISISNTTEYQQIPTMSYNISISNSTLVAWQDLNSLQYNISLSNTTQYQQIHSLSYNISFSNTSEVWDDIPTMLYNISFSNSSEELVFISPGVYFGVGNVNYSTNQTLGFTQIVQRDNSIMFNTTNFTLDCTNPTWVNLSMIYTNGSTTYTTDELVCDFWADNTGGTSWFNISGFSSNGAFYIHHNNTFLENVNSNASGGISFDHNVNNNRSYKIYNGTVAVGRTWQSLPFMSFNLSFSNFSQYQQIPTMSYNITFSNLSTFNDLFGLQFNLSFSNTATYNQIPTMSYNISLSNTTSYRDLNTLQYNLSFSNTSQVEWTDLPYMTFNMSLSNSSNFEQINTMSYNISISNLSTFNNINTMQYNISFSAVEGQYTQINTMTFNLSLSNTTIYQQINTMTYNISFSNSSAPLNWTDLWTLQYNFSFSNSSPPLLVVDNEYPANNSNITSRQPLLYFNVTSPQGYNMNYTLYIDNTTQIAVGKNIANGTQQLTNHTYFNAINFSRYWWRVMLNDGQGQWVNYTFSFRIYPDVDIIETPGFESVLVLIAMFGVAIIIWKKRGKEK